MKSNVRSYTDQEILDRVKTHAEGFIDYPKDYWCVWIRSNEDQFNVFDDKMYVFHGTEFKMVARATTNAGKNGLKNFESYNADGVAVLKADVIVYESHYLGLHKGKIMAYRQGKPWPYYRDNDKDDKAEEIGNVHMDIIYANIHPADYNKGSKVEKEYINGWSLACLVPAVRIEFDAFMTLLNRQKFLTNCILNEF